MRIMELGVNIKRHGEEHRQICEKGMAPEGGGRTAGLMFLYVHSAQQERPHDRPHDNPTNAKER